MVKLLLVIAGAAAGLAVLVRILEPRFAFFPSVGEQSTPVEFGIPFESRTLDTADGERLRGWELPGSDPRALVLYFHGNGGNLSVWLPILAGVQREGFTVAAIDYRGYGSSTGRPSERGLYRDVDAALEWARALARPGVPIVYWGRSIGTAMAAYAATKRPPDGLILESGFPSARALFKGSPPMAFLSLFSSYRFPTADYAKRARCPILVMHGDNDDVIPFSKGQALYEALPAPKQFVRIAGGDHNDVSPPDPAGYWNAVKGFVGTLRHAQGTGAAPDRALEGR